MNPPSKVFDFKKFINDISKNKQTEGFPNGHIFSIPFKEIKDFMEKMESEDETLKPLSDKEAYPPTDILEIDESTMEIIFAIPGFYKSDLSISVDKTILLVEGKTVESGILLKNISIKPFSRSFTIPLGSEISARVNCGLLIVTVEQIYFKPENYLVIIK